MKNEKQSEKEKIKELEFTQDIQKEIFASLLACSKQGWQDPKYVSLCMSILKPESFDNPILQNFFKIIKKFYDEYDEILTPPQLSEEVKLLLSLDKNKRLPEDEYLNVLRDILKLEREAISFDYSRDKIIQFAQYQAGRSFLIDGSKKHLPKLEFDKMIGNLEKIRDMAIDFEDEDVGFKLTPLSEVEAEEIDWLWYGIIPKGKVSLIVGDPDVGKSFLTHFLSSYLSIGKSLPHTSDRPVRKSNVFIFSAEDGLADTIRPRIDNIKGDPSKITIVEGIKEKDSIKLFNYIEDIPKLEKLLERRRDVKLLIIDPITSYMRKIDMKMDAEIRSTIMAPLAALAEKFDISILLVAHLNKNEAIKAIYRVSGSVGFLAAARTVWLVMEDSEDMTGERRKFCCLKMNIAKKPKKAMLFKIYEPKPKKPTLTFLDEVVSVDIESELSGQEKPVNEAKHFLKTVLKDGKRLMTDIEERAKSIGIKERTLYRAKTKLGIISDKGKGKGAKWYWKLSEKEVKND